ncbi:MAG: subunit beta of phenylalanyl-tRNA synthetase [Thermoleophilia bacterium]|nr:subunit beta of phenylalanyl-tRNA synthetase [Thermoleophilia bacterium]
MIVPYTWLTEYLTGGTIPSVAEAVQLLTVSGTAVESVRPFGVRDASGSGGDRFRIGHVRELTPHPDADKLKVAQVDVGDGALHQIVCGAPNVAAGETVAVVLPGGVMPDGMKIRAAKLRGVESNGMLMSERELGLSNDHSGLMLLPGEWQVGDLLNVHVPLGDDLLELEVTGNRPDCLGVYGVARELAAAAGLELVDALSGDAEATATGSVEDYVAVELHASDRCPRYMARAFTGVTVGPSPHWLRARLVQAGMRSINNVVDVTNYVMLVTGQPLHAFDSEQIGERRIVVRLAEEGERITTLDDVERTLTADDLVIADGLRPAVIAGVMGAAHVEVSEQTTSLVLEAACFDGHGVQRTSRRLGLRSESSSRFEKGLDPYLPEVALRLASKLFVELCGAEFVPGTIDACADAGLPALPVIVQPSSLASQILGIDISADETQSTLEALGFHVDRDAAAGDAAGGGAGVDQPERWKLVVPHWRMFDVTRPIDVVEELGRFRLDRIPSVLPPVPSGGAMLTRAQRLRRLLEDTAAGLGLHEVVTYGLVAPDSAVALGEDDGDVVRLANPMTADHAELRTSLAPSHLEVARRNIAAGMSDVAVFEVGRTFHTAPEGTVGDDGLPRFAHERDVLSMLLTGSFGFGRWDAPGIPVDAPMATGVAAAVLAAAGIDVEVRALPNPPSWLHPGQAAQLLAPQSGSIDGPGALIGWVAALHPRFTRAAGVEQAVYAVHLDLASIDGARSTVHRFAAFSEFPPVFEDISIIVADDVQAGAVLATARIAGGDLLEHVTVFDRYAGSPIEPGSYSLSLRMAYRAHGRTLTDLETAEVRRSIVSALAERFGAQLRGSSTQV